jgi:hypothetical protein
MDGLNMYCDQTKNERECMLAILVAMILYPFFLIAAVMLRVLDLVWKYIWHIVYALGLVGFLIMMSSYVVMGLSKLVCFQGVK